ncbi:riboflavin synthase domain-like protein [Mytilinidion resinicola]|uniref:NADPH-dependent diflavin oxidoreductase 1 n=1 Tax=Mytilinidion resinicola TaxID=574789 RepID=A0A6A6YCJ4_9PEZI|nr:riboflavin synthase domain-like protein [Mytilinidion resinicola]KAF2806233.1 riboflavin synthase domain-like protein [Mytilinidion resinicola]
MAIEAALAGRTALVLYGSETGNAQDVAEELGRMAERLRFSTQVSDFNSVSIKQLLQHSVVLISVSTTGQGDLPGNALTFWRALRSKRLQPGCLKRLQFASFGLGDTSYPKFNWAHRKLYNRLIQLGAERVCDRGESDEQHPEGVDGSFIPWSLKLRESLLQAYPLPEAVEQIPDDVLLEPKWLLQTSDTAELSSTSSARSTDYVETPDVPSEDLLDVPNSLTATIASNTRVTLDTHWQDVRHLTLTTPGRQLYTPGDILTIFPKNFPSDVNQFLSAMKWTDIADVPIKFISTSPSGNTAAQGQPLPNLMPGSSTTLRSLLTNHLDIMAIPRRSFFSQLAHYTSDTYHRDRLLEFTDPQYIDELYDYTTRPRRSILEVLQEFESVQIPWQRVCSIIPVMRGRQFSIASGGRLKHTTLGEDSRRDGLNQGDEVDDAFKTRFELLIAIVKYRTVIKRLRQGVCSRYVASLKPGQSLSVTLQKGGLGVSKADSDRPVVMVGPGTGVAPMRALIYERMALRQGVLDDANEKRVKQVPRDVLFFGCRNSNADYFFKDEWQGLQSEGVALDVFPAFSRDQRSKVYVQDLVRTHASRVYEALATHSGIVCICGSSGKMPQAVREALIEVFQQEGTLSREEAEAYMDGMEKSGRYKQETW